ncbi:MAG: ribonuclease Z [Gammaproteobacteria bacterium]|nr:ribonuclease Z [Gammaproteobacteria bacterium]
MSGNGLALTVLGSGTGVPVPERACAGYWLQAPKLSALVDCGSGVLRRLAEAGGDYRELDAVFVTHTHVDHVGELALLLHALKATPGFRRERPLHVAGPPGFPAWFEAHVAALAPPKHLDVRVAEAASLDMLHGVEVRTVATRHTPRLPSLAYRFAHADRSLVVTGDADRDPALARFAAGADLLVADCSFPDALKVAGHMSATECGHLASEAGVGRLVLSHLYPVDAAVETRLDEARAACAAEVLLARDGLRLALAGPDAGQ